MKKTSTSLLNGLVLGAASWAIVPLVSDRFEPFDSELGLYLGQSVLSVASFYFGYSNGLKCVFIFIIGVYVSSNVYPYLFGSSEQRTWGLLGLITAVSLCVIPLAFGILGKLASIGKKNFGYWLKKNAAKRGAP